MNSNLLNQNSNIQEIDERGTSFVEFTFAFPVFMITVYGTISFLLLMFNILGAHISTFVTLREVAVELPVRFGNTNYSETATVFAARMLKDKLNKLSGLANFNDAEFHFLQSATNTPPGTGTPNQIRKVKVSCYLSTSCGGNLPQIEPGEFISISVPIEFLDFSTLGLPRLTINAFATMKMQEVDE
ncbi:MAG TPA: hypothetical protein PKA63_08305 [Oligoflexia bacterium]|nr:hypothetical protein [Oligoflexia bacterium]HMP48652.1 hypothetical protein [Oligoflexia bacterium]